jgi:hypothetical protein
VQEYNVPQASSLPTLATLSTEYLRGPDLGGGVGGMVCSIRDGEKIYSHSNHRGDVIARTDGTGSLTWFAIYEAYGTRPFEWGTNLDRQKANTKDEEAELGLLNEGGLNQYVFCDNNPVNLVDPFGESWGAFSTFCSIVCGAAVAVAVVAISVSLTPLAIGAGVVAAVTFVGAIVGDLKAREGDAETCDRVKGVVDDVNENTRTLDDEWRQLERDLENL